MYFSCDQSQKIVQLSILLSGGTGLTQELQLQTQTKGHFTLCRVPGSNFIRPKKRQSPMEFRPWGTINNIILGSWCAIVWKTWSQAQDPHSMRREKVHQCVLLRMRKKEKEKYWSHNSSVLPMKGPDQASFYYFNLKMVGTCLWSWVSIFAQPNSLPKSQPMEPKCVVMEDSHSWWGLVKSHLSVKDLVPI